MPLYKIYRLKESQFQQFRWAPHASGASEVKRKDYEAVGEIEAQNVYAAWSELKQEGRPLRVGDLLECESDEVRIYKYVGFEEAHWALPDGLPAGQKPNL